MLSVALFRNDGGFMFVLVGSFVLTSDWSSQVLIASPSRATTPALNTPASAFSHSCRLSAMPVGPEGVGATPIEIN